MGHLVIQAVDQIQLRTKMKVNWLRIQDRSGIELRTDRNLPLLRIPGSSGSPHSFAFPILIAVLHGVAKMKELEVDYSSSVAEHRRGSGTSKP